MKLKRLLSVILALILVIGCVPLSTISAQAASNYEYAWFPAPSMNLTQIAYESYSHASQNAIDFAPGGNVFAPFTGEIVYLDSNWGYAVLQSTDKVYYADGTLDYMTVAFMHDESISNLYLGQVIAQGTAFYQAGGMGGGNPSAYADHVHLSVHKGQTNAITSAGKYGAGDVYAYDAFYVNSEMTTSIINEGKMESGNYMTNGAPSDWTGFWKNLADVNPYLQECTFYPSYVNMTTPSASPIWNMPCSDSTSDDAEKIATTTAGASLTSTALYLNTAGNYWYRVTYNGVTGYIYGGNTSYVQASLADVTISDVVAPSQIIVGSTFAIGGTITSRYNTLCEITASVYSNDTDDEMFSSTVAVNTKSYSLKGSTIDNEMTFNTLPVGSYNYSVGANVKNYITFDGKTLDYSTLYCGGYETDFTVVNQSSGTTNVTLTLNTNGGSCSTSSVSVASGSAVGKLPYPTRSGYIFEGWYTAASGGTQVTSSTTFSSNTTIYAHWSDNYEDLGSGFYAVLSHPASGNGIVNVGGNVELGEYGSEGSIWYFERYNDGTYILLSAVDGFALDVENGDWSNATNLWVYERNDTNAQKWFLQRSGSGYILISVVAGMAMDIDGGNSAIGTNVQIYTRNGSSAQVMDITNAYQISYDANGGTGAPSYQWKLDGTALTLSSAAPINGDVNFLGWATTSSATEAEYQPGDTFTLNQDTTLYAVWGCDHSYSSEIIPATCLDYARVRYTCVNCGYSYENYVSDGYSDWSETYPEGVDESLIESKTQYRYSDYETTTSYETSLDGWTRIGSSWQQSGTGSVQYVKSWPSGFSTSHSLYSTYNKSPKSASETETDKTTINSDNVSGYLYYHWCRGTYTAGPINRTTKPTQQGEYNSFHAFYSTTNPSTLESDTDGSVVYANASCCTDSHWYFHTTVNTQSYTTYTNLFSYARWTDWSDWSDTAYTETDNRSVQTRTLYRYVSDGLGDHVWESGSCVYCGEADPNYDTTPMGVHVQSVMGWPDDLVGIPVFTSENDGFAGFTLTVDYDSRMTLVDIAKGDLLSTSDSGSFTANVSGNTVTWVDSQNITEDGILFVLYFQVPTDAIDGEHYDISVALKDGLASNFVDENAANKNVFFESGYVLMEVPAVVASGWSGSTTWTLTDDGVLTFYGNGDTICNMKNYGFGGNQPWISYADQITSVVVENGVTAVGTGAFMNLTKLESVTLPDSGLKTLGQAAFYGCSSLKEIYIPDGVYTIWAYTFKGCTSLTDLRLPTTLCKLDQGAFENCTALVDVVLPGNVDIISYWAFKGCTGLTSVDMLWTNATEIRAGAFKNCTSLTDVILPADIQVLGDSAFYAIGATTFTVPETVTTIEGWCFARSSLKEIIFEGDAPTFGDGVFNKITLTARYPSGNATWTADIMQNYGGTVTWTAQ